MTPAVGSYGARTIFSYDANTAVFAILKDFDGINGGSPVGSLIQASDGKLYGTTSRGGRGDYGVIFLYDPAISAYTKLIDFNRTNGAEPHGSLLQASDRKLYGMTIYGRSGEYGVTF